MTAGPPIPDVPRPVDTVVTWSGGRHLHLLTAGEIGAGRRNAVVHATRQISDVDEMERALRRIFRGTVQRRIPERPGADVWFEVR